MTQQEQQNPLEQLRVKLKAVREVYRKDLLDWNQFPPEDEETIKDAAASAVLTVINDIFYTINRLDGYSRWDRDIEHK